MDYKILNKHRTMKPERTWNRRGCIVGTVMGGLNGCSITYLKVSNYPTDNQVDILFSNDVCYRVDYDENDEVVIEFDDEKDSWKLSLILEFFLNHKEEDGKLIITKYKIEDGDDE